ncbi:MAG TPA: Ppx/GppA phosphatase family protein [Bacteroidota bacterium]|nr:Ppx/GppA phosphatase family protein [Bacteroidota bacterium]
MNQKKKLAAIDVGTNSIHLIVAEVDLSNGQFKILDREKEVVRLGAGSTDMKYLSEGAMERGVHSLRRYKVIADSYDATIRAVATSAVREALNQGEFIRRVKTLTGITLETASGFEEARLIHLGALQALPIYRKKHLLVDIGGGSTEFLLGHQRKIIYNNSLKLGAVRLTQRFFPDQSYTKKQLRECREYVRGMLSPVRRAVRHEHYEVAAGTSGTILNLAGMIRLWREEEEDSSLNNYTFSREDLFDIVDAILEARDPKDRIEIDGLDPARADIIVAGAVILREVFEELNIKTMTVSEYALREGIILDTIEKLHRKRRSDHLHNLRYSNVRRLAETFHYEKKHARQVTTLALKLFDQTTSIHRMGTQEREYLEAAAVLHEVGLFVSHAQHHRHSYYLIRNSELLGYTENEKEIIANIARYHRKSHPKIKHEGFGRLSADDQRIVSKLAAILRIADGLDRTHSSAIRDMRCRVRGRRVNVNLQRLHNSPVELELWGAERKKDLFEKTLRARIRFVVTKH